MKTTIDNCVDGVIQEYFQSFVEKCLACQNGQKPNLKGDSCSLKSSIKGCLWETFDGCKRCRAGYTFDKKTKQCKIQSIAGCLIKEITGTCKQCNYYEGYFMTMPGVCAKQSIIRKKILEL